jgi:histone-lysine N-methyltransferase SETMAR
MEHAPYSPDRVPSDYHVFGPLKNFLAGQRFISDGDADTPDRRWFRAQTTEFYNSGVSKLVMRWDKCLNRAGDCVANRQRYWQHCLCFDLRIYIIVAEEK